MITVRWSPEAATDFAAIVEYIRKQNPSAAERAANKIYDGVVSLASFPRQGRAGRTMGTRELVLTPLPYIVGVPGEGRRGGYCAGAAWVAAVAVIMCRPRRALRCRGRGLTYYFDPGAECAGPLSDAPPGLWVSFSLHRRPSTDAVGAAIGMLRLRREDLRSSRLRSA